MGGPSKISPYLFVGSEYDSRQNSQLHTLGITHLLCVETSMLFPEGPKILHRPLEDFGETRLVAILTDCAKFIDEARAEGGKVLIYCALGQNRSPTVAIAYSVQEYGITLRDAYAHIAACRDVPIHDEYLSQLQEVEIQVRGRISLQQSDIRTSLQELIEILREELKNCAPPQV